MKRSIVALTLILLMVSLLMAGCGSKAPVAEVNNPGESKLPTPTASPVPQVTEEFKAQAANEWSDPVFITGNQKMTDISNETSSLLFTLRDVETYAYKFYNKETYGDVIVEADVANLGDNTNGMALICRASEQGWYEFRVASGGTYEVFVFDQKMKDRGENPYKLLESGGTGLISAKSNKLQFICQGNSLKIMANGKEIKPPHGPMEDSSFTTGKIGVGAMSFTRVPVKISFDKVSITQMK